MKPEWHRVALEHVRRACEMYESGAVQPRRPAQNTFLLLNGRIYPAKFIGGLAYHLATGVELDPNRDYSGGTETARFFQSLGLTMQHGPSSIPAAPAAMAVAPPPSPAQPVQLLSSQPSSSTPQRRQEPQKEALAALLRRQFGATEREAKFPWLTVPPPDQMDGSISGIYHALQGMRGYSAFATFGKSLCCDFFVPVERLVIEYDERQHFTMQRAKSLELYPPNLALGFDRDGWMTACRTIRATDPTPPYRDEQRAFYDSLRDILAARNGIQLIRMRDGIFDWTSPDADEQLSKLVATSQPLASQPAAVTSAQVASCPVVDKIKKVALVSHNYNLANRRGLYDYSEHFARINKLCDEQGCDTILYALYTWDLDSPANKHWSIFEGMSHVQRIVLEVGQPPDSYDHVETWVRERQEPILAHQQFARSTASTTDKQRFIDELGSRQTGDALLMICGESNIVKLKRASKTFEDWFGFCDRLQDLNVSVVLNPIHDYMTRYEMREKRRFYSGNGRTVLSVWNQGRGKESHLPWNVFHDQEEGTDAVQELPRPFSDRPDIRIGIVDVSTL